MECGKDMCGGLVMVRDINLFYCKKWFNWYLILKSVLYGVLMMLKIINLFYILVSELIFNKRMCYVWWSNDDDVYIKGCVLGKILKGYVKIGIKIKCWKDM